MDSIRLSDKCRQILLENDGDFSPADGQRQSSQPRDFEQLFRQLLEKETSMRLKDDSQKQRQQRDYLKQIKEIKAKREQFEVINRILAEESKRDS